VLEVLFTGAGAAVKRDRSATAQTYLWMHPIYGGTALVMEEVSARLKPLPRPLRALAYTAIIYAAEYGAGWFLKRLLGRCPWDYSRSRWNVHGLIRLDYAPAWYLTALLFEPVRDALLHITSDALRHTPEYREAEKTGELPPEPPTEGEAVEAGVVARRFDYVQTEPATLH